jgi:hypothetical protein
MSFRGIRGEILSNEKRFVLEALAEYLVKVMAQKPGLSRERILAQLEREYGGDVAAKLGDWERKSKASGREGSTFLGDMSEHLMATMPAMMGPLPT